MSETKEARTPKGTRYDYNALALASCEELERVMRLGSVPTAADLAGWEFKGWNTSEMTPLLGIRKFKKGFYQKDRDDELYGYNVQVLQNYLGEPWVDKLRGPDSIKHGWFNVYPVRLDEVDNKYPDSALLNYGASDKNLKVDPSRTLRDYLVKVYPDNPDLFLGKAYLAVGPTRVFVSYFILERNNRSTL